MDSISTDAVVKIIYWGGVNVMLRNGVLLWFYNWNVKNTKTTSNIYVERMVVYSVFTEVMGHTLMA